MRSFVGYTVCTCAFQPWSGTWNYTLQDAKLCQALQAESSVVELQRAAEENLAVWMPSCCWRSLVNVNPLKCEM